MLSYVIYCNFALMKKLKHIVNWTIWSLLGLYIAVIILLHIPFVQRWTGSIVASLLSEKLDTRVSIGRIDLGFLNRLIIDDVTVYDRKSTPLLTARRLTAKIDILPLMGGHVSVSSAQIFGAHVELYRDSAGVAPNYQFLIDALSSDDSGSKGKTDIRVNSLIIRHSALDYNQLDTDATEGRFDTRHLSMNDITAHVVMKHLTKDSLWLNVKRLAFRERSGLTIERMAMKIEANRNKALLTGLNITMPHSTFNIDTLRANYDLSNMAKTISCQGSIENTIITPADLSCFCEPLSHFGHGLNVNTNFRFTTDEIEVPRLQLISDDHALMFNASLRSSDLRNAPTGVLHITEMRMDSPLINEVCNDVDEAPTMLTRLGNVRMTGTLSIADGQQLNTQSNMTTDAGDMLLNISYNIRSHHFNGHVVTDSLNMRQITDNDKMGLITAELDVAGNDREIKAQGKVGSIGFHNYTYNDINIDAAYSKGNISGHIIANDPNMTADIEGAWHNEQHSYRINLTGDVQRIAPSALNITDRWGKASFSGSIEADFTASTLADAEGEMLIKGFNMTPKDSLGESYSIEELKVTSGYVNGTHRMNIASDFGEMQIEGDFDLATLPQSFINHLATRLPTMPGLTEKPVKGLANNFMARLHIYDTRWLSNIIGIPLTTHRPIIIHAEVNEQDNEMELTASMPDFAYNDNPYRDGKIHITTQGDSTLCSAGITKITNNRQMDMSLTALAADNRVTSTLTFDNTEKTENDSRAMKGALNTITHIYDNDNGRPEVHIRMLPSSIMLKGTTWEMEPSDILYSDNRLIIDHFYIRNEDQHLMVDGIASENISDSVMVEMNNVDVAYLLELANFRAVQFGGPITGRACIVEPFGQMQAWADIRSDDFLFQQCHLGPLEAHAMWNTDDERIDIDAIIDDGADKLTFIGGYVSPKHNMLDLGIRARGTNIAFVHSFTRSFLGSITGQAFGDVHLTGPLKQLELTGDVAVNAKAHVSPLGTDYRISNDTVHLTKHGIEFRDFICYDRDGNTATLNGEVSHRYLKHFTFDLSADAKNALVYDFPDFDGGTICGTVRADGHADIIGRSGEVTINCDVTPTAGSVFAYNTATTGSVNRQQFITWEDSNKDYQMASGQTTDDKTDKKERHSIADRGDLYVNFRINTTPDATIRLLMDQNSGDYITINGNGTLRASYYNKGPFQLFGTYNVEQGTYSMTIQNIIKKNFSFQPDGTITFSGNPFEANLNLKASYTVNGVSLSDLNIGNSFTSNTIRVNCLMNILGTAEAPRVEFDLEMPTVNNEEEQMIRSIIAGEQELNQQVVYLLGIGRFYTQGANNSTTQNYRQTELAMQSLLSGTVSTQINEILSQVIKNEDWNFGANISTGNEGWHNAEYEGVVSGRMLNNRLLINGQFGYRDNATQATPSFIGDFDISYLLTPNGNLALKVYNQTNERYFTRSTLNTQGIGLMIKRDFNGLRDLFQKRKKKKN